MDAHNLTQGELAQILDVDRGTILNWQRAGMPYREPDKNGLPASYVGPICINWHYGRKRAQERKLSLSALEAICFGWAHGYDKVPPQREIDNFAAVLSEHWGEDEARVAIGYGLGLVIGRR